MDYDLEVQNMKFAKEVIGQHRFIGIQCMAANELMRYRNGIEFAERFDMLFEYEISDLYFRSDNVKIRTENVDIVLTIGYDGLFFVKSSNPQYQDFFSVISREGHGYGQIEDWIAKVPFSALGAEMRTYDGSEEIDILESILSLIDRYGVTLNTDNFSIEYTQLGG